MRRGALESTAATLLAVSLFAYGSEAALAQSYSAKGQIGYLQEWEMKADLAKTTGAANAEYAGATTLRHVGLCSDNGVEEKTGTLALQISARPSRIEGTLSLADDQCHLTVSGTKSFQGLMRCRNGEDVPISLSVEPEQKIEPSASAAIK